jgi:hypothetical protein
MTRVLPRNFATSNRGLRLSNVPIECHITLKPLPHQEIVELTAKEVIVGFATERERAAVVKECAKLQGEPTENIKLSECSLTFENILPQALPRQKAPLKVKKDVSERLQVVSPSKL